MSNSPRPNLFPRRRAFAYLAGLAVVAAAACRHDSRQKPSKSPATKTRSKKQAALLPPPLTLVKDPPLLIHFAKPADLLARHGVWLGQNSRSADLLAQALSLHITPELARNIGQAVAIDRPWTVVALDDRTLIWNLPLVSAREAALKRMFDQHPAEGKFGARRLPGIRDEKGRQVTPYLAWMDPDAPHTLSLATSTRGLVTAIQLPRFYGDNDVAIKGDRRFLDGLIDLELDYDLIKINALGDARKLEGEIEVRGPGGSDPLASWPIGEGTLVGLMNHPQGALGATTRYRQSAKVVADILRQVNRQVAELPLIIRGNGEMIAKKLRNVLNQWEGRTLVGTGPSRHLRLALGVDDAQACERMLTDLIATVDENLEMAASFVSGLPKISRKGIQEVSGHRIARLKLSRIKEQIPREIAAVLNRDGSLDLCYCASLRENALMLTLGENAEREMVAWIGAQQASNRGSDRQIMAASSRVDPQRLLQISQNNALIATLLTLEGNPRGPLTSVSVERRPGVGSYHFTLSG
jgi:hypothetical protein